MVHLLFMFLLIKGRSTYVHRQVLYVVRPKRLVLFVHVVDHDVQVRVVRVQLLLCVLDLYLFPVFSPEVELWVVFLAVGGIIEWYNVFVRAFKLFLTFFFYHCMLY